MDQTDRNLLFAVLAFQNEYLNLSQLSAACRAWSESKSRPMPELLLEKGWLDESAHGELQRLLERKLKRFGGDPRATLGAIADAEARNAMRDTDDPQMTITLSHLRPPSQAISYPPNSSVGPPAPYTARETLLRPQEARSRYTLTQIHGEGGLGRIWSATDADLNRDVALKELLPEQSLHPEAVKRFVREAQVTGQLEHPNIVPVYELGHRPEDEMPFYTMRFIRGRTLKDAIADYHHLRRDKQDSPLDRQRLLNAFVSICHAIGYAHSRAVIHRDLKPDNIILGPFGEVIVLDWGLAKIVDQREEDLENDTLSVTLTANAQAHETVRGRVMGTPAYMAPEQAEGRLDLIDPRTDIYGLGAVLFEMLTGRVPHQGKTVPDLLRIIVTGSVPRPRDVEPTVPKPLDAICAKAMARKRADRYQNAEAMADDVLRWLADEPVSVYREPFTGRLLRWFRKNRARALAAAASLLLVTGVSVAAAVLIDQARQQEASAKVQALDALQAEEVARAQATQRLREARQVVDLFLGAVGQELSYHPVAAPARARLFERAAKEYERFASQQSDDPDLQAESAQAFLRLGKLRIELGQLQPALEAIRKAEAAFRDLADEPAAPREFTYRVADCRVNAGYVLARLGEKEEAEQHYHDALALLDPLLEHAGDDVELGLLFSRTLTQLAQLQIDTGRSDEAEPTLVRAREVVKLFVDNTQRTASLQAALAAVDNEYGDLLFATGREDEAADLFRESTIALDLLVEKDPDEVNYRASLVNTYVRLALVFHAQGELFLEFETYKQAIADMRDLVRVRPDVPAFRENLAVTQLDYGQGLRQAGLAADSREWIEQALTEYLTLTSTGEGALEPRYIEGLGASRSSLAHTLSDLGLQDEAAAYIAEALLDFSDLTTARPNEPRFREGQAIAESIRARILARQGDPQAAAEAYSPAIEQLRALIAEEDLPRYRESISEAYANLARIRLAQRDENGAALAMRQARDEWELLVEKYPQNMRYRDKLAWVLAASSVTELRDAARAVSLSEETTRAAPESPAYWRTHALAQYRGGQYPAAAVSLASSLGLRKQDDGISLLVQAMIQSGQGEPEKARDGYDKALTWIARQQPADEQVEQFRTEAASVLGIGNDQP